MQSGTLRFRLEIQQAQEQRGDIGDVRQDWVTVATVWGDIAPLTGRELWQAQQIEARLSHRLTLRQYPDFNPTWRLRLEGTQRVYNPVSVRDVHERHRMTEILAIEIVEAA